MLEKLSRKIGFTPIEIKVILFLAIIFLFGFIYKEFFIDEDTPEFIEYDYTEQDSLFNYYSNLNPEENQEVASKNNVDIKREVLELSERKYETKESLPPLTEKSINLNTADLSDLIRLPGIGEVTADKILELRNKKGSFNKLEELLEVKGIGNVKFNKIKKFLYIE